MTAAMINEQANAMLIPYSAMVIPTDSASMDVTPPCAKSIQNASRPFVPQAAARCMPSRTILAPM